MNRMLEHRVTRLEAGHRSSGEAFVCPTPPEDWWAAFFDLVRTLEHGGSIWAALGYSAEQREALSATDDAAY